ncbi:MAG: FAD-dependent oxidoreductase [Dehalococcoidia bacterium]|nr:FAD-dependent oxidoreductase [Dehalococcoidia bacterium]
MKILEPIQIKNMKLKNRIGLPSLLNMPGADDSSINDLTIRWFESRAKGGAGLIMTGSVASSAPGIPVQTRIVRGAGIALYDDRFIPGFARLAKVLHSYGAMLGVQMGIVGGVMGGRGPSPPPYPDEQNRTDDLFFVMSGVRIPWTEVTIEQIERSQNDIAAAAARAKAAGVDAVELHCAHGGATGGCSFISPYYNHRTDKYGGSWENRLRYAVETIQKIRQAVGDDFPVFVRLSTDQLLGNRGITIEDTCKIIVPTLEKAGVDCIDCSQGDMIRAGQGITIPLYYTRGCFIHFAAAVKKSTRLPVIGVGRIVDIEMAEKFLQEGKADIIFMGRQLVADPDTPKKYFEGRKDEIRTCIGCLGGCGRPCPVNYDIQDNPVPFTPAEKAKKVFIIGGGVGGMEAARIAAMRGHKVTLFEKDSQLGGMVAALALTKLTSEFGNLVDYLGTQMRKLKVDVRICREATPDDVNEIKPDVIIVATGSSMVIPEIARGKPSVMHHIEALKKKNAIGQRVVIWGLVAAELAISLAEEGKDVVIIGRGGEDTLARDYPQARRFYIFRKLTDINVPRETPEAKRVNNPRVLFYVDVEAITPEGITVVNKDGAKTILPYDTLIISREREANDSLFNTFQGKAPEVYKIGDCAQVGDIQTAVWSANEVARKI